MKKKLLNCHINVPYITGSDSHYPIMLGCVRTCFDDEVRNISQLKEAIKNEEYTREISEDLNLKVYTAKAAKNYIKKKIKENKLK